jgi:predicted DNA-binding protein
MDKNYDKLVISTKKYAGSTSTVSARLPVLLIERIDRIAKETGRTRNEILERCIEYAVDNMEIV